MRLIATFIVGLFLSTTLSAQQDQPTPQGLEDIEQQMLQQIEEITKMFEGNMLFDTTIFKNFNLEGMDIEKLQDLQNLNPEDLMEQLGGNGIITPENFDMQSMMKLLEESMQGMDMGNLEQLFGPLLGDMENLFPKPDQQEEEDGIIKDKDGRPIQKKKKTKRLSLIHI